MRIEQGRQYCTESRNVNEDVLFDVCQLSFQLGFMIIEQFSLIMCR